MAFDANSNEHSEKVKESLKSTRIKTDNEYITEDGILNVPKKDPMKKKRTYTFSLYPEVREYIDRMAKENNYSSSSELLNTIFNKSRRNEQ
ncbi:hypothetical protein ACY2DA_13375 [Staphylococcus simulans]